ncbi:MAG: FAD-dependent oxidoreductase [Streptosporangiaceae bacterium]|jgi:glycine/D-amino acid oxidase-like deaminating enzyme
MTRFEAAVVGGGIIGCMVAREIAARRRDASVVVIDQEAIGSGASRRSAGLHIPRGYSQRVRQMSAYSERYYDDLRRARPHLPIRPVQVFVVARRDSAEQLAEHYLAGALTEVAEPPAAVTALARAGGGGQAAAVWRVAGGQRAEVALLARELAARQPALRVLEGVRVSCVEPRHDDVLLHLSTGEVQAVARVVLAPGPWIGGPAWRELLAPLGARVKKVVALYIDEPPAGSDPVVIFEDEDAFLMPVPERGAWLFSYTCQEWDVDPDTLPAGLSARDAAEARTVLRRYAPWLERHCAGGRLFCDAYSADRQPLVQSVDPDGRIIFAGAANGSGYRLAPAIAAQAADFLDGGPRDDHQYL